MVMMLVSLIIFNILMLVILVLDYVEMNMENASVMKSVKKKMIAVTVIMNSVQMEMIKAAKIKEIRAP